MEKIFLKENTRVEDINGNIYETDKGDYILQETSNEPEWLYDALSTLEVSLIKNYKKFDLHTGYPPVDNKEFKVLSNLNRKIKYTGAIHYSLDDPKTQLSIIEIYVLYNDMFFTVYFADVDFENTYIAYYLNDDNELENVISRSQVDKIIHTSINHNAFFLNNYL